MYPPVKFLYICSNSIRLILGQANRGCQSKQKLKCIGNCLKLHEKKDYENLGNCISTNFGRFFTSAILVVVVVCANSKGRQLVSGKL